MIKLFIWSKHPNNINWSAKKFFFSKSYWMVHFVSEEQWTFFAFSAEERFAISTIFVTSLYSLVLSYQALDRYFVSARCPRLTKIWRKKSYPTFWACSRNQTNLSFKLTVVFIKNWFLGILEKESCLPWVWRCWSPAQYVGHRAGIWGAATLGTQQIVPFGKDKSLYVGTRLTQNLFLNISQTKRKAQV